jgi:glycine/D-amino acid oxidase-like deaminating enzyme
VLSESGQVVGVRTSRSKYEAPIVVNCAGSWAGQIHASGATLVPSRPIKGQMLDVVPRRRNLVRHVIHGHDVYIVPRSDGRVLIGATVEDVGFDKRVSPDIISRLHLCAAKFVPELSEARIHEAWAGLRPGSPDDLPILGHVGLDGYFVATGHFRNGILLAPVTARIMADLICRGDTTFNLAHFSAVRFQHSRVQA